MYLNNRGVTLIEVMLALVVLLLVFVGLVQTALLSIDNNLRNIYRDEAVAIATERMSELKTMSFDALTALAGTGCQTDIKDFRNIKNKQFTTCARIDALDADTNRIRITVGWDHRLETAAPPVSQDHPTGREFDFSIASVRRR